MYEARLRSSVRTVSVIVKRSLVGFGMVVIRYPLRCLDPAEFWTADHGRPRRRYASPCVCQAGIARIRLVLHMAHNIEQQED